MFAVGVANLAVVIAVISVLFVIFVDAVIFSCDLVFDSSSGALLWSSSSGVEAFFSS